MKHQPIVRLILLALVAALAAGLGCATVQPPRSQRATKEKPYDFQKEGTVPAADTQPVEAESDVEEMPVTDEPLDVEEAVAPPDTAKPVVAPPAAGPTTATVDGFRVQVFASADEGVAEAARRAAQARLGLPAYSELVDGLYKVRVGDCLTRADAEAVLATCRAVYYKDAWIVDSKVVPPKGN